MLNDVQLITIEGGIGVGKSTVLEALHAAHPEICITAGRISHKFAY